MPTERQKTYGISDLERQLGRLTVGEFLSTWRASEDLSLKEFGKKIGFSVANLCDIEKGRKGVSPGKAERIAKAIGVPPALLVRLAIEESLKAAGLKYRVEVTPVAAHG
jgi:transcriptional regulator with XRE-family HTH domain